MEESNSQSTSYSVRIPKMEKNIIIVAKGGGITFVGKIFLSIARLATAVLLARLLGAKQYGMYTLAISIVTIVASISVFGLDSALIRYIAILNSRQDRSGVWGALQVGIGTAVLFSVLSGVALYGLSFILADQVFHEPGLAPLFQLASVFVPLLTLSDVLSGAVRGFKRMDFAMIAQFVAQPVVRLILIVIFALVGLNASLAVASYGLADLSASILLIYFINKVFPLKRPQDAPRRDVKEILTFSVPVWLSELMSKFQNNIQTLVLGTANAITGVGVFSVANQLTMVTGQFSSSINVSAKPVVAELHHQGDIKQLEHIYQSTTKWSLMVQLPVFLTLVLFPAEILSIFGQSFAAGAPALVILALADLINVGTGMGGIIIDMTGHTKLKLANSIIRLIIYIGLSFYLIPSWGLIGAAVVALAGEGVVNLLRFFEVYILLRILPYNQSFIKPLVASALSLICVLVLGIWIPPQTSVIYTMINIGVLFLVYIVATLLLGLSDEERAMLAILSRRTRLLVSKGQAIIARAFSS